MRLRISPDAVVGTDSELTEKIAACSGDDLGAGKPASLVVTRLAAFTPDDARRA